MKFVYLCDTHVGGGTEGYRQQPPHREALPELLARLDGWIRDAGDVDFVLHGGDMVDSTTEENLRLAARLFRLSVPVRLCLGNHDLTRPDALEMWLRIAPEFFPHGAPEYPVESGDVLLYVIPNHWDESPYFWEREQDVHFRPDQIGRMREAVERSPAHTRILATHTQFWGVPEEQTGFDEPFHPPPEAFQRESLDLLAAWGDWRMALSAHMHMDTRRRHGGIDFVATAAFAETPFEFRVVEADGQRIQVSTLSLAEAMSGEFGYDDTHAFAQGRPCDRDWVRSLP